MDRLSIRIESFMSQLEMLMGAAGVGGGVEANYIEDVFSTYLYNGNGSTQTITNNIDLSTKGGLVWNKCRSTTFSHQLYDTVRGATKALFSNLTDAQTTISTGLTAFSTTGYTLGSNAAINSIGQNYCSWTFREQAKFFDVVTYTGNSTNPKTIDHNLGSTPGCIIIKVTSKSGENWIVWHRSLGDSQYLILNSTAAAGNDSRIKNVGSTSFQVSNSDSVNDVGQTYVAYLFAHDAGGFGTSGSDNVISCGSFTTTAGGAIPTVTLGYEPQYLMFKCSSAAGNWNIIDTMRGFSQTQTLELFPNSSTTETDFGIVARPTATGFTSGDEVLAGSATFIYMAIRRGPMKVPTLGTSVYSNVTRNTTGANATIDATITPVDLMISVDRNAVDGQGPLWFDRLRGATKFLRSPSSDSEITASDTLTGFDVQNGYRLGADAGQYGINSSPAKPVVYWNFKRAPGFFDEVCYTGTGSARTVAHNLTVVPELMIVKSRSSAVSWGVYTAPTGATNRLLLNSNTNSSASTSFWNDTAPTSSVFTVGTNGSVNGSGNTYVAYLFATCAGVSKVGSYTGNGGTQTINCGFTGGARFVLIKRTDDSGDWYVYDTARGMVSGTDPFLLLNTTDAEVNQNDVFTTTTGFQLVSAFNGTNRNAASYIFLAIA